MINPDLMKLGLHDGATVALAEKGTAGAPCRSAVFSAGVEARAANMVVACPDRGLKLVRPPTASATSQLHDIFSKVRADERDGSPAPSTVTGGRAKVARRLFTVPHTGPPPTASANRTTSRTPR